MGGGGALNYWCNRDLLFWGKNTPKQEFHTVSQPILPSKQDFFWNTFCGIEEFEKCPLKGLQLDAFLAHRP